ncbi:hypothetical protein AK812_SmicGene2001 [Symbiodinium microadriaticum]|uniref:Uncharacterized protein n=1 Tax=Symbiodinium microadriaticum TaxID=2951 RepID=A0A1Q9F315_SYMMI|nr:hypothetical protein AK812_SmicGene2001 [Symbiodinium microadriaticum]
MAMAIAEVVARSPHREPLCPTQDPGVRESDESEEEDLMAVLSSCREAKAWGVLESLGSKQEDQGVLKQELSPSAPSQAGTAAATCQSVDEHLPSREALHLDRDEASGTCTDGAALGEPETERGPAPGQLEDVPAHRDRPTGSPSSRFETSPISALVLRAGSLSTHGSRASQFYDLVKLRRRTDCAEGANGFFETYRVLRKRGRGDTQASTTTAVSSCQDEAWHPAHSAQEGLEGPEKVHTEDDSACEDVVTAKQPEGSSPSSPTASPQKCSNAVFAKRKRTMQPPNKQRSVAKITAKRHVATPARASADAALVAAYTSSGSCGKSSNGPALRRPKWQ